MAWLIFDIAVSITFSALLIGGGQTIAQVSLVLDRNQTTVSCRVAIWRERGVVSLGEGRHPCQRRGAIRRS